MIKNAKNKWVTRRASPRGPVGEKPPSDARAKLRDVAVIVRDTDVVKSRQVPRRVSWLRVEIQI